MNRLTFLIFTLLFAGKILTIDNCQEINFNAFGEFQNKGISINSPKEEIKKVWKELAVQYHPDKSITDADKKVAECKMLQINTAYDDLLSGKAPDTQEPKNSVNQETMVVFKELFTGIAMLAMLFIQLNKCKEEFDILVKESAQDINSICSIITNKLAANPNNECWQTLKLYSNSAFNC